MKVLLGACFLLAQRVQGGSSDEFRSFMKTFGVAFETAEEEAHRETVFVDNLARMERLRVENPDATFAVNKFADLTKEEFRAQFQSGYKPTQQALKTIRAKPTLGANVTQVDWRTKNAVSKVYDQGQCGCCWAISVTETLESAWYLSGKGPLASLSWQQLICCDCGTDDVGCNGGDPELAYKYIEDAGGVESLKDYPFTDGGPVMPWEDRCNTDQSQKGRCDGCSFDKSKAVASLTGYSKLDEGDEGGLEAMLQVGPVSVCIDADPWQLYDGGVLSKCGRDLDHCVQVVGYDKAAANPYWLVKNSWGTSWGEKGYIRIGMGGDLCGIADVATYPTLA